MSHELHERAAAGRCVRFAVLTLSDTRTPDTDASGRRIVELTRAAGHHVAAHALQPDDPDALRATLVRWLDDAGVDAIVTNGGTGLSRRDATIPVVEALFDAPMPGFGELFRALGFAEIGSAAMLSRATAGVARGKWLIALPGSTNAVTLAMRDLVLPQAGHVIGELRK